MMDGMIFAAGLGTRLRPLTNDRPKAMVEVGGKPLLEHIILKMREAGVDRIVVNVHHYADQIVDFLARHHYLEKNVVISDERDCLLDTGGGLLKARHLFTPDQPVLIHNVDIFSEIDLKEVVRLHIRRKDDATLVVRPSVPGRGLRFNDKGILKGWENNLTGEQKRVDEEFFRSQNYSFCGVQVVSPHFLQHMIHHDVFSIIDEYLAVAATSAIRMKYYEGPFLDLGTPEAIAQAEKMWA